MIEFETHSCDVCGEQFCVACFSELQEKLKKHTCSKDICAKEKANKKRERSQQFKQNGIALFVHDTVVNRIEEHNFDKLVEQGVII